MADADRDRSGRDDEGSELCDIDDVVYDELLAAIRGEPPPTRPPDELDPLCSHCHALKTNENWQLVAGKGRRRFVPPDHPNHPGDPPTSSRRSGVSDRLNG